ncbi:glycosyltransferase, family 2 [Campylobacter iguaniorum]|uniref:Glycosyltransferase, family 2 n=1 Tax=Campylobacter iguaniorum TaxID=1244531 RepID=A0A076FB69_9BACT|nr:glycosyltransferase family 2 protein [Campylobacter iguaniorum]AII15490.1 glycosyltransferase, family 2 [Campylobacter iguaniorum]
MYKICFLIPYFNHPRNIVKICEILKAYDKTIVIIDDGSDEASKKAIKDLDVIKLSNEKNLGKGAAVKTGFAWALEHGFTHAFQVDADMQHDLRVIPKMLELSATNPSNLICGYGKYGQDIPKSRLYGRKITDFWVYINTFGGKFKDAMTGMRIYPLDLKAIKDTTSNRMEFDIEILMNYYKNGVEICWIEVPVRYGEISYFRSFRDNFLISKMQAKAFFTLPFFIYKRLKSGK